MDIDLKQIRELMRALKQFDLQELVVEKDGERIKLRRGAEPQAAAAPAMYAPSAATSVPPPALHETIFPAAGKTIPPAPTEDADSLYVTSPFVGTFYRSPSPDAPSFVEVGDAIRAGQTLCIVEAMKLMNEIEAEFSGKIAEVLATNGKPVEYGDRLFRIKKG